MLSTRQRWLRLLMVSAAACNPTSSGAGAIDPADGSPHVVRQVRVSPGVELEVLDWGGAGQPIVFLAGFGNSAHVFDTFAPQFRDDFRVFGITRRGFGGSTLATSDYDNSTLVADLIAALGALQLKDPVLIAHSFGGAELNGLATAHPNVPRGLIYLDGGFDFAELYADPAWVGTPIPRPPAGAASDTSMAAQVVYFAEMLGPGYPESELRAGARRSAAAQRTPEFRADSLPTWLMRGTPMARRELIRVPALAIYGVPGTVQEKYPWYERVGPDARRLAEKRFAVEHPILANQRRRFRAEVAGSRVVEIAGGRHYIFLTHADETARYVREFARTLSITE